MAKTPRAKTAAIVSVPQSREEANEAIFRIGDLERRISEMDIGLKDALAKVKDEFERLAAPLVQERAQITEGLCAWAEAHRAELTQGGRTKTVSFPAGEISWMTQRPSIGRITAPEAVISWMKANGLDRFVRVIEEINRAALLDDPDTAASIPGIKIGGGHEAFSVKPFSPQGLEAAS